MMAPSVNEFRGTARGRIHVPEIGFCHEKSRLLAEFLRASREMITLQNEQTQAVINGDADFPRFDILIHLAQERKEVAKYAWIAHVDSHACKEATPWV